MKTTSAPQRVRWGRLALMALALVGGWYTFSYQRDWFFYHLWQERDARSLSGFGQALKATGAPLDPPENFGSGSRTLPWWVARIPADRPQAPTVCLMTGVHGNEPAGPLAVLALLGELARPATSLGTAGPDQDSRAVNYVILPLVNPWGWSHDLRHNAGNRDIARSVVHEDDPADTPEARLIRRTLRAAHCSLLLDLHEDRQHPGFYVLAYDDPQPDQLARLVTAVAHDAGVAPASHAPAGLFHVPRNELAHLRLTTPALWARHQGSVHALIFETWDGLPLAQRVRLHRLAIRHAVQLLASPPDKPPPASSPAGE